MMKKIIQIPQRGEATATIMQMDFWPLLKGEHMFEHQDVFVRTGWETLTQSCFYMFQMPNEKKPRFAMGFECRAHASVMARRRINTLKGAQS